MAEMGSSPIIYVCQITPLTWEHHYLTFNNYLIGSFFNLETYSVQSYWNIRRGNIVRLFSKILNKLKMLDLFWLAFTLDLSPLSKAEAPSYVVLYKIVSFAHRDSWIQVIFCIDWSWPCLCVSLLTICKIHLLCSNGLLNLWSYHTAADCIGPMNPWTAFFTSYSLGPVTRPMVSFDMPAGFLSFGPFRAIISIHISIICFKI